MLNKGSRPTLLRLLTMIMLAAAALVPPAIAGSDDDAIEAQLAQLNRQSFEDYMLRHDVELYSRLTLPEYRLVVNIGIVETRDQVLATATNLSVDSLRVEHDTFVRNGDTALVSGVLHVEGTIMGHPIPPRVRYLSVFVQRDGEWRLLTRSLTENYDPRERYGPAA